MINLSIKAADRFGCKWTELKEQRGDCWKLDIIMVSRYPVLLIIHEYTLFTLVRRKTDFKTIESVVLEITRCCPWYKHKEEIVGKNTDKKLNGSINEMKRCSAGDYSENYTEEIEEYINTIIFSSLSRDKNGYRSPMEALEEYKVGKWPDLE